MKNSWYFTAAIVMLVATSVEAGNFCGELTNAIGPFDYRKRSELPVEISLVERGHFNANVENGIKGQSSGVGGDLDYTLRAWPNHQRALAALGRYAVRTKAVELPYATYPVECYFDRAMRFAPDDGAVRAEYGNYLFALGQTEKAFVMYRAAVDLSPDNPTINYNVGLAYLKKKDYERALTHAKKAYALGFPLPGLKNKLIEAGKWDDTPEAPAQSEAPQPDKPAG